ncbi:MAG TPA: hypothetical protein DEO59_01980 [Balneola sp.]|jgi:hypothetical protein|nr:hypothetical protein [Balneola sp.]MAO77147.1 hypothetical protein [Balneola sp.]MBF63404.1 hypothetical protein [Balneola sp.]HBZ37280.1 hypothetical protein [Balneola sp.]|tara:strand:+ start:13299 stop:14600 length:1302 start_codon:yes stop_codon:yes gene_type:complete
MNLFALHKKQFLKENSFGFVLAFIYSFYGVHVTHLIIINGSKGIFLSPIVILFCILMFALFASDFLKSIVRPVYKDSTNILIVLFLSYYFISVLSLETDDTTYHLRIFLTQVIPSFLLGILAFTNYRSWSTEIKKLIQFLYSPSYYVKVGVILSLLLFVYFLGIIPMLISSYISDASTILTINTEFYQVAGDYFIITYLFLTIIKVNIYQMNKVKRWSYVILVLFTILEFLIYTSYLQILGSNKTPLMLFFISAFIIFIYRPKLRLSKQQIIILLVTSLVLIISMGALVYYSQDIDLSKIRFFKTEEGSSGVVNDQSLTIRIQQVLNSGLVQINKAPLFGDLSIVDYMHSSLISSQTHLGVIGFLLLWTFILIKILKKFMNDKKDIVVWIAFSVVVVSILSSVFYWAPLWFVIGGLYADRPGEVNNKFILKRI